MVYKSIISQQCCVLESRHDSVGTYFCMPAEFVLLGGSLSMSICTLSMSQAVTCQSLLTFHMPYPSTTCDGMDLPGHL